VVIHSGFVYVSLLFDPQIEAELASLVGAGGATSADQLLSVDGDYFIKSLSLASLVENFPVVFPEEWERERLRFRSSVFPEVSLYQPPLDTRLKTILFQILPHFLRSQRDPRQKKVGAAAILNHLAAKIPGNRGKTAPGRQTTGAENDPGAGAGPAGTSGGAARLSTGTTPARTRTGRLVSESCPGPSRRPGDSALAGGVGSGAGPLEPPRAGVGVVIGYCGPRGGGGGRVRLPAGQKTSRRIYGL